MGVSVASIGATWAGARSARRVRQTPRPALVAFVAWLAVVLPTWRRARTAIMQVTAFAFLDFAAWRWSMIAGCAAVGVSLLVLEALGGSDRR